MSLFLFLIHIYIRISVTKHNNRLTYIPIFGIRSIGYPWTTCLTSSGHLHRFICMETFKGQPSANLLLVVRAWDAYVDSSSRLFHAISVKSITNLDDLRYAKASSLRSACIPERRAFLPRRMSSFILQCLSWSTFSRSQRRAHHFSLILVFMSTRSGFRGAIPWIFSGRRVARHRTRLLRGCVLIYFLALMKSNRQLGNRTARGIPEENILARGSLWKHDSERETICLPSRALGAVNIIKDIEEHRQDTWQKASPIFDRVFP